jgi:hypothetical protein
LEWIPDTPGLVHIIGPAVRDNIVVYNYDSSGERIDLLVNTIGAYDGYKALDFFDGQDTSRFQVQAGGPWSIEIIPLRQAQSERSLTVPGTYEGTGDDVVFITGAEPDIGTFKSGPEQSNFIVYSYGSSGRNLLVNEISPYEGVVIVPRGPFIITVQAVGPWTMDLSSR